MHKTIKKFDFFFYENKNFKKESYSPKKGICSGHKSVKQNIATDP